MGLLLSAFAWSYALLQLPVGGLVDRAGSRVLLGAGMTLWSVAYLEIERHMSTFGTGFAAAIPFRHSGSGPAASDPAIRRGRHGYRARQDIGRHHRGRANDWLCRSSGGCAHLDRRDDRQERGRLID